MKQAEIAAHSYGRRGGDKRVFDKPAAGVLQMIATATVFKTIPSSLFRQLKRSTLSMSITIPLNRQRKTCSGGAISQIKYGPWPCGFH
jgi:hypothetical protein